jgi:ketosteroid isomerase-like protein
MSANANVELVKRLVLGPGDHDGTVHVKHGDTVDSRVQVGGPADGAPADQLSLLHPDVVVHIPPSMPYGGDHVGREAFVRMAEAMGATWRVSDGLDMTFTALSEDQVACLVSWTAESRHTGRRLPMLQHELYTIADGQITDIRIFYWDTAAVVEATDGVKTLVPPAS